MPRKQKQTQQIEYQLRIVVSEDYKIQCSLVDKNEIVKEQIIQIKDKVKFNLASIRFKMNEIIFSYGRKTAFYNFPNYFFMKELMENPEKFEENGFAYCNEEYFLVNEVLFAIFIHEFKRKAEREHKIELSEAILELPDCHPLVWARLKKGLEFIYLTVVSTNEEEEEDDEEVEIKYKYDLQKIHLEMVLDDKESMDDKKYRKLEREKKLLEKEKQEKQRKEVEIKETQKKQTKKQKDQSKQSLETQKKQTITHKNRLDPNAMFIASQYFSSFNDFENLEVGCKRFRGNLDRFTFNPISVDNKIVKFFKNLETLHLYTPQDKYIKLKRIERYIDWTQLSVTRMNLIKGKRDVEFKNLTYSNEDIVRLVGTLEKQNRNQNIFGLFPCNIPDGVKRICTTSPYCNYFPEINIPSSVTYIDRDAFAGNTSTKSLTIPSDWEIFGRQIMKITNGKIHSVAIPTSITRLNGKPIQMKKIERFSIPSHINLLDPNMFSTMTGLTKLELSNEIKEYSNKMLKNLVNLKELKISNEWELTGNRLFRNVNHCLESLALPPTIEIVNGKRARDLVRYTIPSNVTKLGDYCFAECSTLQEINGFEQIKQFGVGCFYHSPLLNRKKYHCVMKNNRDHFRTIKADYSIIESECELVCSEIIFDSEIDSWAIGSSIFNERIKGKKQIMIIIEDTDGEIIGQYINNEIQRTNSRNIFNINPMDEESFYFHLRDDEFGGPFIDKLYQTERDGYRLYDDDEVVLFKVGLIVLYKESMKKKCRCDIYTYNKLRDPLYYQDSDDSDDEINRDSFPASPEIFTPARFLVIQMEKNNEELQRRRESEKYVSINDLEKFADLLKILGWRK